MGTFEVPQMYRSFSRGKHVGFKYLYFCKWCFITAFLVPGFLELCFPFNHHWDRFWHIYSKFLHYSVSGPISSLMQCEKVYLSLAHRNWSWKGLSGYCSYSSVPVRYFPVLFPRMHLKFCPLQFCPAFYRQCVFHKLVDFTLWLLCSLKFLVEKTKLLMCSKQNSWDKFAIQQKKKSL